MKLTRSPVRDDSETTGSSHDGLNEPPERTHSNPLSCLKAGLRAAACQLCEVSPMLGSALVTQLSVSHFCSDSKP